MKFLVLLVTSLVYRHWQGSNSIRDAFVYERLYEAIVNLPVVEDLSDSGRYLFLVIFPIVAFWGLIGLWVYGLLWGLISLAILLCALEALTIPDQFEEYRLLVRKQISANDVGIDSLQRVKEIEDAAIAGRARELSLGFYPATFWFLILGPTGALIYLLSRYYVDHSPRPPAGQEINNEVLATEATEASVDTDSFVPTNDLAEGNESNRLAKKCVYLLEWLPARFLGLVIALIGNFSDTISAWFESLTAFDEPVANTLVDYLQAATVYTDDIENPEVFLSVSERKAESLTLVCDRLVWGWVGFAAIVVILNG